MSTTHTMFPKADSVIDVRATHEKFTNLPISLLENARVEKVPFDAKRHIAFEDPSKIFTMEEIGNGGLGISPNAVSAPFPLFPPEAIQQMRGELFSDDVVNHFHCMTSPSTGMIRGHCPNNAPFINSVWNSPEVLAIISKVAGIDLVPALDYDIGQANISINSDGSEQKCLAPGEEDEKEASGFCESAFGWHTDTYPFVVVTMLSDCTGMVGGETSILTGHGEILKAPAPSLGRAVVMQGRYVRHQATAARGGQERISMVTSFRPRDPHIRDDTILRGVRNISHVPTLYNQYTQYRLENLEERVRKQLKALRKRAAAKQEFDTEGVKQFLLEQRTFLDSMIGEIH